MAAAIIGSVSILGGAAIGAVIDSAFDGTVTPFVLAGLIACSIAYVLYRWSDASWERDAERELIPESGTGFAVPFLNEVG